MVVGHLCELVASQLLLVRKVVALALATAGTGLLVLGLAEASGIPAADARARALDDYAGVALMTFASLVLLLPVGFVLASAAHLTWPEPGRIRARMLGISGITLALVEAWWLVTTLSNGNGVDPGILTAAASGGLVLLAALLDLRIAGKGRQRDAAT